MQGLKETRASTAICRPARLSRRRHRRRLWLRRAVVSVVLGSLLATTPTALAGPAARSASTLSAKDEGHLHFIKASGSLIIDEGSASGTIPGRVRVHFTYDGAPTVSAEITIYAHAGSINAHGSGRLSSPTSTAPSFKGSLSISGGSGRYAHAHGVGHLYGVFNRRSYALIVQTEGTLRY
ncbi:MAG TPA: hypothetical protein VK701_08120 [Solirubrobacteraceae bacterium]|jgi:hypothetical protein|nr:hypothetical protein [Solirubrobacteraceae bacterium]